MRKKNKVMRVDQELINYLKSKAKYGESLCGVVKRLLGIDKKTEKKGQDSNDKN